MAYTFSQRKITLNAMYGSLAAKRHVPEFVYDTGWRVGDGYHIKAHLTGYYSRVSLNELEDMEKWLENNASGLFLTFSDSRIYLEKEEDVAWFMLRWG